MICLFHVLLMKTIKGFSKIDLLISVILLLFALLVLHSIISSNARSFLKNADLSKKEFNLLLCAKAIKEGRNVSYCFGSDRVFYEYRELNSSHPFKERFCIKRLHSEEGKVMVLWVCS